LNSESTPQYKAAIFDMDGLLLDTEIIYTEVTQELVSKYGKTFPFELKSRMMGRKALDAAQILVSELKLPISPQEYLDEQKEAFQLRFPQCGLMPGVSEYCRILFEKKIPMAVATSSSRYWFEYKTKNHQQLFSYFKSVTTGDDDSVKNGKPAPDIFFVAAERLGMQPEDCVVFEDSVLGVEAVKNAGMGAVAVPDARMDTNDFNKADFILDRIDRFSTDKFLPSSL
jgi:pseudouridine-5'-monophosphatase